MKPDSTSTIKVVPIDILKPNPSHFDNEPLNLCQGNINDLQVIKSDDFVTIYEDSISPNYGNFAILNFFNF